MESDDYCVSGGMIAGACDDEGNLMEILSRFES